MLAYLKEKGDGNERKFESALNAVNIARNKLRKFTMHEDVYQEFIVREFLIARSWITYLRNQERQEGAGIMAALARLNNLEVVVWVKNPKTGELEIAHHTGGDIGHHTEEVT